MVCDRFISCCRPQYPISNQTWEKQVMAGVTSELLTVARTLGGPKRKGKLLQELEVQVILYVPPSDDPDRRSVGAAISPGNQPDRHWPRLNGCAPAEIRGGSLPPSSDGVIEITRQNHWH